MEKTKHKRSAVFWLCIALVLYLIHISYPTLSMAVRVKQKGDESKISGALQRLMEEDPTIGYEVNSETVEQVLSGLGEQHLDVVCAKLKRWV